MTERNLLVVQGGGPTQVLNATLAAIVEEAQNKFGRILGAQSGVKGFVKNGAVDLGKLSAPQLDLLRASPGAALGSSRAHVRTQDLADLPLILPGRPNASRRMLDGWLSRGGIRLTVKLEADDHLVIRALVKEGVGFSLLSQGAFLPDLRFGELQAWPFRPRAYWSLALVATADERRPEITTALAGMIRETVRQQVRSRAWPGVLLDV